MSLQDVSNLLGAIASGIFIVTTIIVIARWLRSRRRPPSDRDRDPGGGLPVVIILTAAGAVVVLAAAGDVLPLATPLLSALTLGQAILVGAAVASSSAVWPAQRESSDRRIRYLESDLAQALKSLSQISASALNARSEESVDPDARNLRVAIQDLVSVMQANAASIAEATNALANSKEASMALSTLSNLIDAVTQQAETQREILQTQKALLRELSATSANLNMLIGVLEREQKLQPGAGIFLGPQTEMHRGLFGWLFGRRR